MLDQEAVDTEENKEISILFGCGGSDAISFKEKIGSHIKEHFSCLHLPME